MASGIVMGLLSSGCGAGEAGEWFGVAVAGLPPEVLHRITAGYERTHTLSLYFRVRRGHAECYWRLADISQESKKEREAAGKRRLGDAMVLEGVIAGEEIVGLPDGRGSQVTDD